MTAVDELWVPLEVASLDRAREFYLHLGLSEVDSWDRDGERGAVLAVAGPAFVELVQPAPTGPAAGAGERYGPAWPRVAFALRLPSAGAVDAAGLGTLVRFPRGHYGAVAADPDGTPILLWSEA